MKIFFYTLGSSECGGDCNYITCTRRFLENLKSCIQFAELYPLWGTFPFISREGCKTPKRGDLFIMYARDGAELLGMNALRESLEGFKKVLVVKDSTGIDGSMYHHLAPRYITQENRDIEELGAVVKKMKMSVNPVA